MLEPKNIATTVPIIAVKTVARTSKASTPGLYSAATAMRMTERDEASIAIIDLSDEPLLETVTKTATNGENYDMHVFQS